MQLVRPEAAPPRPAPPVGIELTQGLAVDEVTGLPLMPAQPSDYSDDGARYFRRPENAAELREAYLALARAIEGHDGANLFAALTPRQRADFLAQLEAAVDGRGVAAVEAPPRDEVAARSLRASTAAVLGELIAALATDEDPRARAVLARAVRLAVRQGEAESFAPLRRAMSFGLQRVEAQLPEELRAQAARFVGESAPVAPPYAAWLRDGRIVGDIVVDGDALTEAQLAGMLRGLGFAPVPGTRRYERSIARDGTNVRFEINVRTDAAGIFDRAADPEVDFLAYFGHADYGRALPNALSRLPAGARGTDKLFLSFSCFSKDNFHDVLQRMPELQIVGSQSFGNTLMSHGVLSALVDGIAEQQSWREMQAQLDEVDAGNWITPAAPARLRRLLDLDGDGRADLLDRTFDVELDRPRVPHLVSVASWLNRGASTYNQALNAHNPTSRIIADGTFPADSEAPVVRFRSMTLPGGEQVVAMALNAAHAGMSPAVLRVAATYELNTHLALTDPAFPYYGDALRSRLNGLMAAAFTLSRSAGVDQETTWAQFLAANGLPRVSLRELQSGSGVGDFRAGNHDALDAFIARLQREQPALVAELSGAARDPELPRAPARRSGLPEELFAGEGLRVTHGHRSGSFYCIHSFFLAQEIAARPGSSIARNREGEPLVGFLHVPHDRFTDTPDVAYDHAERFGAMRAVVGRALRGYVAGAAAQVDGEPIRVLHTGFGTWFSAASNPSGHFVRNADNVDAAMRAGFGADLMWIGPRRALGPGTVHAYRVRIDGRERSVEVLTQELPVSDDALNEQHPDSLPRAMRAFRPHATLLTGVAGSEFRAEWRATDDGLNADTWQHDGSRGPRRILPDNFSLARVLVRRRG